MKATILTTQLGEHRGKKRFFLEGIKLLKSGIRPGNRFSVVVDKQAKVATLSVGELGSNKVSVRRRNAQETPVIDLKHDDLGDLFWGMRLRVTITKGIIAIRLHHTEAQKNERESRFNQKRHNQCPLLVGICDEVQGYLEPCTAQKVEALTLDLLIHDDLDQSRRRLIAFIDRVQKCQPALVAVSSRFGKQEKSIELERGFGMVFITVLTRVLEDFGFSHQIQITDHTTDWGLRLTASSSGLDQEISVETALGNSEKIDDLGPLIDIAELISSRNVNFWGDIYVNQLTIGSLSHGIGVMDYACHTSLEQLGIRSRLKWAVEIDNRYLEASYRNNPVWDEDSFGILSPMEHVNLLRALPVSAIVAGLPCVGASLSGRTKNKLRFAEAHPDAGHLFVTFILFCLASRSSLVVLENVSPYFNTESFRIIEACLEELGYNIQLRKIGGNEFGALEDRERVVMVASSRGCLDFDLQSVKPIRKKEATLGQVLEHIPANSNRWKSYAYLDDKAKRDAKNGKGFTRQLRHQWSEKVGTIGKSYQKARSTEPFVMGDDGMQRLLTPLEHARCKTITPLLIEGLSDQLAHEGCGQSVIQCAFEAIFQSIASTVLKFKGQLHGDLARA